MILVTITFPYLKFWIIQLLTSPSFCTSDNFSSVSIYFRVSAKSIYPFVEDNDGKTSLDYAKEEKKVEILKALINNKYGSEQDSLLHLAAMLF